MSVTGLASTRRDSSILGISVANAHVLKDALSTAARTLDAAVPRGDFGHGMEYKLAFPLSTSKGTATVVSGWIVRHGEDFPRLTTCYILQTNER